MLETSEPLDVVARVRYPETAVQAAATTDKWHISNLRASHSQFNARRQAKPLGLNTSRDRYEDRGLCQRLLNFEQL